MKSVLKRSLLTGAFLIIPSLNTISLVLGNTRTLEFQFALSSDARSEFKTKFMAPSPGRIVIEAIWKAWETVPARPTSLSVTLFRPDGSEASRKEGASPLTFEHEALEKEIDAVLPGSNLRWTLKIFNRAGEEVQEGRLRITVPVVTRKIEDTQFTLLGLGNAQEIPFTVSASGRVIIEAKWEADPLSGVQTQAPVTLSLVHQGQSLTYARRQGKSPLRIEHQVTEQQLDTGRRWIVRVQNDGKEKLKGALTIIYTPSL